MHDLKALFVAVVLLAPGPAAAALPVKDSAPATEVSRGLDEEKARLAAEIEARQAARASRPKTRFVTPSTEVPEYREYVGRWLRQVDLAASQHLSEEARREGLSGRVVASAFIARDGTLLSVEVNRSSGSDVLDQAVLDISELAGPYPPLPTFEDIDVLCITQTWLFVNE